MLGPTVGAALVVALQNYLAASAFPVTVLIGIIFVVCVLVFRRGMVGELLHYLDRRRAAALSQPGTAPADRVTSAGAVAPPPRAATPEARSDRSAGLDAVGPDRPAV
jgi:hypothetical protein